MKKIIGISSIMFYVHLLGAHAQESTFKLGVENISPAMINWLRIRRIALITNQTGVNQQGVHTKDVLAAHGIKIRKLCAPEHGIHGVIQAEHTVKDSIDATYQISVVSLYENGSGKKFSPNLVEDIDAFVFDIQDSGMRHYTYISTLFYAITAAAHHKKSLVVLDRPNPLGRLAEGPLVDSHVKSFIAVAPIPLRHGMTVGELAHYFNTVFFNKQVSLHVVPMSGYQEKEHHIQKCAMNLSPNIQTLNACFGYSFLGLLGEIRPFDVGIGTPLAFQCITMPKELTISPKFWISLRTVLEKNGITSTDFTYYSTRKKKQMVGLKIHVHDIRAVSTCNLLSALIFNAQKYKIGLTFSQAFDTAIGSSSARTCFEDATAWSNFMKATVLQVQKFCKHAQSSYMYKPNPICVVPKQ